jgi:hypothetical protein
MTPGTFLFDSQFRFKDGKTGRKIFLVLNSGEEGSYLAVKTTSRGDRYGIEHGCQVLARFPNFHLVKGSCCLTENTWVQLDSFFEFEKAKLIQSVISGEINQIGTLSQSQLMEMLICASHSEDLSGSQENILQSSIKAEKGKVSKEKVC